MAIRYENECVGCPPDMGCLGVACSNRRVPHLYCDKCKRAVDILREYDGDQWCEECILKEFDEVEVEE